MQKSIRCLIFDLGGVIVYIKKIDFSSLDRRFKLRNGTIRNIIKTCVHEAIRRKKFNERLFFEKHFAHTLPWRVYSKILSNWFKTERVNTPLIRWIERRRQKYNIYLLTNQTGALSLRLKNKYRIAHHFDRVFNSAEIGIAKPDPRIFRHLLLNVKANPRTCLFVDNKFRNISAARKFGFQTIYFKNNKQFFAAVKKLGV